MNWLSWIGLLLLKDILDMKYSCSDVVGSQGALVHWLLIRVRVLDLQMCSWGQQHYHLWWSRNLAIWAAPRHYLVDLDGEKDQAVKKMETPSTSPGPLVPTCWTQEIYSIWVDINFSLRLCWRMKIVSPKILFIRLGIVHLVSSECLQEWSSI